MRELIKVRKILIGFLEKNMDLSSHLIRLIIPLIMVKITQVLKQKKGKNSNT